MRILIAPCWMLLFLVQAAFAAEGAPATSPATDWRTVLVDEAFPESLADLDNNAAASGGASGTGTAQLGSFAVNAKGQMAVTFFKRGAGVDDLVVARSDDGRTWRKHQLREIGVDASDVKAAKVVMTFVATGPGPQVQINAAGDVCLAAIHDRELATAVWPANEQELKEAQRITADVPLARCGLLKFDRQIGWFQLYSHGDRFVLVTKPQSDVGNNAVRVYELVGRTWTLVGDPIAGLEGSPAWDDDGTLYLGVQKQGRNVNGTYPAVMKWDASKKIWTEITAAPVVLKESFGITSYPGGGCPAVVAHKGQLWAFWWQGNRLQAATYRKGTWESCARTSLTTWSREGGEALAEVDSFGQGGGIYQTTINWVPQTVGIEAFFDSPTGDVVVFACDGQMGLVVREGKVMPILACRVAGKGAGRNYHPKVIPGVGEGFDTLMHTSPMMPHTVRVTRQGRAMFVHATMRKGGNDSASDVFVFRYTPLPYRDIGIELKQEAVLGNVSVTRVVERVVPGSPAAKAGLRPGDEVTSIERVPKDPAPKTGQAFLDARLGLASEVIVKFERNGATQSVRLSLR